MRIVGIILGLLLVAFVGVYVYYTFVTNPRVARELVDDPNGARAQKVMLLKLPSGREIPVNYWRDGDKVFAGADGRWWRELEGGPHAVELLVRGERLRGQGRAVLDDEAYKKEVFAQLRPDAVPGFGTLIEVVLDGGSE